MNKIDIFIERYYWKVLVFLVFVYTILYVAISCGTWIWTDESYTFAMIKHSFSDIWNITAADVHPPLYYFLLKLFSIPFKYSMWSAKLFSIIPYVFIIAFGGVEMGKLFNKRTGIIFMILFFCFPFSMSYATEVRMYSLAAAFVFANAIFAYKAYMNPEYKNWIGFVGFGVAAAYTHYFAFVSISLIYFYLLCAILLKNGGLWKKWAISVVASVILYVPWLSSFINQLVFKANNEYWIGEISFRTVIGYAYDIFGTGGILLFLLTFSMMYLVAFIYVMVKKNYKNKMVCILCLLVPIGTILVGVAASILVRPVFVVRYVVPSVPLIVAFMSIVMGDWTEAAIVSSFLTIAILLGMCQYEHLFFNEYGAENNVPVNDYPSVECYVPIDDSCHMPQTLAYYVTDKPIYYGGIPGMANPWTNRFGISEFDSETVNEFIVLTATDKVVPPEYLKDFTCQAIGTWTVQYEVEAYLLTRK